MTLDALSAKSDLPNKEPSQRCEVSPAVESVEEAGMPPAPDPFLWLSYVSRDSLSAPPSMHRGILLSLPLVAVCIFLMIWALRQGLVDRWSGFLSQFSCTGQVAGVPQDTGSLVGRRVMATTRQNLMKKSPLTSTETLHSKVCNHRL
jgi:hypothetical protein